MNWKLEVVVVADGTSCHHHLVLLSHLFDLGDFGAKYGNANSVKYDNPISEIEKDSQRCHRDLAPSTIFFVKSWPN